VVCVGGGWKSGDGCCPTLLNIFLKGETEEVLKIFDKAFIKKMAVKEKIKGSVESLLPKTVT